MTRRAAVFTLGLVVAVGALPASAQDGGAAPRKPPAADRAPPKPDEKKPDEKKPDEKKPDTASVYSAEVMVLHATNSGKGIDERIGNMPELKKPPFSSYDSYELISKTKLPLVKDDPKTMKLPNGRVLQTKLLEVLPKHTLRISASINQPKGKDFLPLLEVKAKAGQAFIVAGQSYKKGILVLVIKVVK